MRIGRFARSAAWLARVAAVAFITAVPAGTFGQAPPPPGAGGQIGVWQESWGGVPPGPSMPGGFTGPLPMGAGGTDPPYGYDLMNDVGVGGFLVDQRGPHYFDIRAEAVYLERDETFNRDINFTSLNIGPPRGAGEIVLSSRDLEYDEEVGFRVLGRYDIDPLAVFEFGYMGIYEYESDASVVSPLNELFSLFSEFGNDPVASGLANGPMRQTERASRHSVSIESNLQTAELSYRRYWVGWVPRVSGTLLAGFRYTKLDEGFQFNTVGSTLEPPGGPPAFLDYFVDADNNLAGLQTGGDVWIGLIQGLRLGAEGKAGLFNNHYTVESRIVSFGGAQTNPATPNPSLEERFKDDQAAFIGEASIDLVADILPSWSLRVGYEVLYMNSLVTAGGNFNTGSPYNRGPVDNGFGPPRRPFVDDQDHVLYHGGHAGVEYIW